MEITDKVCTKCGQYLFVDYKKFGNPYYVCTSYLKREPGHSSYLDVVIKTKQEESLDLFNKEELSEFVSNRSDSTPVIRTRFS
jgi:hypothetical protein